MTVITAIILTIDPTNLIYVIFKKFSMSKEHEVLQGMEYQINQNSAYK